MKIKRSWMELVVVASLGLGSIGFGSAKAEELRIERPSRWIGQVDQTTGRFGWPGSGFEIVFTGRNLTVTLIDSGLNSLVVETDGKTRRVDLLEGRNDYVLAEADSTRLQKVRVLRRTEGLFGETQFIAAKADGRIERSNASTRALVVLGDSISAGYGIEGLDRTCSFSPDTENQYLTYAARAARALGADVTTLAVSGRGLVRNFDGGSDETMSEIYRRALPTFH